MELTVECNKRPEGSKPKALRRDGLIPASLYGHNGAESISLTVGEKTVEQLLKDCSVNNTLVNLTIPELSWNGKTLLREVQTHPWKPLIYHLSFFAISAQDSVEVTIPLEFVGEAAGVKLSGGILDPVITELQVKCAPDSIPENIEVDISGLDVGDALHIKELVVPQGVTPMITDGDRLVVSVLGRQKADEGEAVEETEETEVETVV
jgi:large subunit ribosomal protein L25